MLVDFQKVSHSKRLFHVVKVVISEIDIVQKISGS